MPAILGDFHGCLTFLPPQPWLSFQMDDESTDGLG